MTHCVSSELTLRIEKIRILSFFGMVLDVATNGIGKTADFDFHHAWQLLLLYIVYQHDVINADKVHL